MIRKLKLCWHILRGKPLIYRCEFEPAIQARHNSEYRSITDCIYLKSRRRDTYIFGNKFTLREQ